MAVSHTPYVRTGVYLESIGGEPKHMFVRIGDLIAEQYTSGTSLTLLDVGAANGEFARYVLSRFPNARVHGVEYDPDLVQVARRNVPKADFAVGDANALLDIRSSSFDVVTMTGTHSIFDDFRPSFSECIRATRDGGSVIVTGLFNDHPIDALIAWRYGGQLDAAWHPGYNLFSKQSVSTFLNSHQRVRTHTFSRFTVPFDIKPRPDAIRSWTETGPEGDRCFRNGIMPLNFEILSMTIGKA